MQKRFLSVIVLMTLITSMLTGCFYEVRTPPPPPRVEIRSAPPYAGAVWIKGHWKYKHGEWMWIPGHWKRPPWKKAIWVPGHWKKTPWGWKWAPGHWR